MEGSVRLRDEFPHMLRLVSRCAKTRSLPLKRHTRSAGTAGDHPFSWSNQRLLSRGSL